MNTITQQKTTCYHCGDLCSDRSYQTGDKTFCCNGCKTVFEILNQYEMCEYYEINAHPGLQKRGTERADKFAFVDLPEVISKLILFTDGKFTHVNFYLPQIHCSSCLWLLENMHKINAGISKCRVDFEQKEVYIVFDETKLSLRKVVETLDSIGFQPHLSLQNLDNKKINQPDRSRWAKIGIAGFCFGNIMMMSFADYAAGGLGVETNIALFIKVASVILSLPVLFYAASEFFLSAWAGIRHRYLNLDFPVALALVITFVRSLYEIFTGIGMGYLDSMTGIVFFMLIGRWLQSRTYQTLSFDRDYKSFFPIAVAKVIDGVVSHVPIEKIAVHDVLQIHSNEIIGVDAMVSKGMANIDYSFVTGESMPVSLAIGDLVYAGGRQVSGIVEVIATKPFSQSYMTNLWNQNQHQKTTEIRENIYDIVGRYFTYLVLSIGLVSMIYWWQSSRLDLMWNAITTVLIVACPCALLLAKNFTYGNLMQVLSTNKFYVKSADVLERMTKIRHIVFDKTGTLTDVHQAKVNYSGEALDLGFYKTAIASLLSQSNHPASKAIVAFLQPSEILEVEHYKETKGGGIEAWIDDHYFKIGSPAFVQHEINGTQEIGTNVVVIVDHSVIGIFNICNNYRQGIRGLMSKLKNAYNLSLVSGDNATEMDAIRQMFGLKASVLFNQSPSDKYEYISALQAENTGCVMMIGDGLNDAGALKQSDVGIAVADGSHTFTPAADAIIDGESMAKLYMFFQMAAYGQRIIFATFAFAAIYNIVGLYFAVQGRLSPLIAAILMPASSITIIAMSYGLVSLLAKKLNTQKDVYSQTIQQIP